MEKIKKSKIYQIIEKIFNDEITKEDYIWHTFLFWSNMLLIVIAILEIFLYLHHWKDYVHIVEVFFGLVFLTELVFRIGFTYIKKLAHHSWEIIFQSIIVISLLAPHLIGNLAILRIIRSLKVLKAFMLKRHLDELAEDKSKHFHLPWPINKLNDFVVKLFTKLENKFKKSEKN